LEQKTGLSTGCRQPLDCRDGIFSGTNDLVEKLTGQKPMPMLDYIVKNKAHFVSQQKNIKLSRT
jgi:hypothetical protein